MIQTKTGVIATRNNGIVPIRLKIGNIIIDDTEKEVFQFEISSHLVITKEVEETTIDEGGNEVKTIVIKEFETEIIEDRRTSIYTYAERDGLKQYLMSTLKLKGAESQINKKLLPYALLSITQQAPTYNTISNDWEMIQ